MPTPTAFQLPTVFWTGAGAVRRRPAYYLAPGEGIEPSSAGSKPTVLTNTPARHGTRGGARTRRPWWASGFEPDASSNSATRA